MKIPSLPNDRKIVDDKGYLTDIWANFLSNLITVLNENLSNEGFILPSQNAANIAKLNSGTNKSRILWNSTLQKAVVNNDGTFKEIITI